jgi:hypothetical protein
LIAWSSPKITTPTLSRSRFRAMPFTPGGGELDHLAGLDVVEAEDAGDAVADGEDRAHVGDVGFLAEVGDLGLEDGRDFGGADIHGSYALLRANLRESSFDFSEASNRREPTLHLDPAEDGGVDAGRDFRVLAERLAQSRLARPWPGRR